MERVGFIGVGMMGAPIALRMLGKGVPVLAYDLNTVQLDKVRAGGGDVATSAREIADSCEIVFASLPTSAVCKAVALGPDGVAGGSAVKIYVETSTLGGDAIVQISDGMAARGITVLDSPIVGGGVALEAGTAGVLVAGPKPAFERTRPAFEAYAGKLFYLGERPGAGQAAKAMNNAVAYAAFLATCEALAVGLKSGLDLETALGVINQGSGANFFSEKVFTGFILQGRYEGTGAIEIGMKDVLCFLEEAERLSVETPMASHVSALQKRVVAAGKPGRDTLDAFTFFTDLAGLPRPT